MSAKVIGVAKSKAGISYEVKYDRATEIVYISYSQWIEVGKSSTAAKAMIKAQEFIFDK